MIAGCDPAATEGDSDRATIDQVIFRVPPERVSFEGAADGVAATTDVDAATDVDAETPFPLTLSSFLSS